MKFILLALLALFVTIAFSACVVPADPGPVCYDPYTQCYDYYYRYPYTPWCNDPVSYCYGYGYDHYGHVYFLSHEEKLDAGEED